MTRILLVTQEKGGVGKSLIARALAEAVPDAPIIEVDASQRLLELKDRVWLCRQPAHPQADRGGVRLDQDRRRAG